MSSTLLSVLAPETRSRVRETGARKSVRVGVLAVVFAFAPPILAGWGLLSSRLASDLVYAGCWAAMAMSLNMLMGYAGQISLGHGALLGVGGYTAGIVTSRLWWPAGAGLVLAAVAGALVAFLVGLPALRLRGLYLAVMTIGFTVLMENSVFKWTAVTGGSAGVEVKRPYIGGFGFTQEHDYLSIVLLVLLVLWLLDSNVVRTKFGRGFFGVRENEQVAQSFGVDTARYKLLAFTLSGAMAGVAGALYGHFIFAVTSETFSFQKFSLPLVALVVIGGMGHRVGVVVAAVAFAFIPEVLDALEGWDLVVGAALLIFTVARHPGGMAEAFHELREARAASAAKRTAAAGGDPDAELDDAIPPLPALPRPSTLPPRPDVQPGAPMLEVADVTVRFGGLVAVDKASLTVPTGRIVGLIGPNGAGKSTLFNAVSGFVPMESGRIRFLGRAVEGLPPHERAQLGIGRTFQHIGLARNLTVQENLLLAQHQVARYDLAAGLGFLPAAARVEAELHERSRQAVTALGFEAYADTPVKNLSGGQQRIVELACTLVTAPDLLLLDEPSAGMAPAAVENLAGRLRELRDELGRTVLLIEHHIPLVLDVCDEIYVLNFGKVLAHGTPADITSHPEVIAAYLGEAAPAPPAPARRRRTRKAVVPA